MPSVSAKAPSTILPIFSLSAALLMMLFCAFASCVFLSSFAVPCSFALFSPSFFPSFCFSPTVLSRPASESGDLPFCSSVGEPFLPSRGITVWLLPFEISPSSSPVSFDSPSADLSTNCFSFAATSSYSAVARFSPVEYSAILTPSSTACPMTVFRLLQEKFFFS